MDPRHLGGDDRLTNVCAYCCRASSTNDHVPARVFLDEPYLDSRTVKACLPCNNEISADEAYLACFIECVLAGSVNADQLHRKRIQRKLTEQPDLATEIQYARREGPGGVVEWLPAHERVARVVHKLAQGHAAYELNAFALGVPSSLAYTPLGSLSKTDAADFLDPGAATAGPWPEIGSRAFHRAVESFTGVAPALGWEVVQEGRYRYHMACGAGVRVRVLLSEYLACDIQWRPEK